MANALGTLFSDIANAIRGKTGDTGTMKPAEFPAAITGISVGSGGDTVVVNGSKIKYQLGSFYVSDTYQNSDYRTTDKVREEITIDGHVVGILVYRFSPQIPREAGSGKWFLLNAFAWDKNFLSDWHIGRENGTGYRGIVYCLDVSIWPYGTDPDYYGGLYDPVDTSIQSNSDRAEIARNGWIKIENTVDDKGVARRYFTVGMENGGSDGNLVLDDNNTYSYWVFSVVDK